LLCIDGGSVIVTEVFAIHPFASVTFTKYVPAHIPEVGLEKV